ncbi:MAG TPA: dihydropteroate synthase [Candidatus Marinimicrobia bacterium]|nr:dihydropteroate synthase [Candidatus Neomarinimicrobiota bacterium]
MKTLPVDPGGIAAMTPKGEFFILKTDPISCPAANILKQQMLSVGGECAVSREATTCNVDQAPAILSGTKKQFDRLINSLKNQAFGLARLQVELSDFFKDNSRQIYNVKIGNSVFDTRKKTYVMGILNMTPDSFSDGGKYSGEDEALKAAMTMEQEGADIIDIGGESTRPGAESVDLRTESDRVIPVIKAIRKHSDIPISVDTYKSAIAEEALQNGADIVNDISGLTYDSEMISVIKKYNATVVIMHIKGTPRNMQNNPVYTNLIDEIMQYLFLSVQRAIDAGISRNQIIIDPGFGFGKTFKDNYTLLRYLAEFQSLGQPILVGLSRKSFIGKRLDLPVDQRLEGSLASMSSAIMNGAGFVRVHDVKESVRAVKVVDSIIGKN